MEDDDKMLDLDQVKWRMLEKVNEAQKQALTDTYKYMTLVDDDEFEVMEKIDLTTMTTKTTLAVKTPGFHAGGVVGNPGSGLVGVAGGIIAAPAVGPHGPIMYLNNKPIVEQYPSTDGLMRGLGRVTIQEDQSSVEWIGDVEYHQKWPDHFEVRYVVGVGYFVIYEGSMRHSCAKRERALELVNDERRHRNMPTPKQPPPDTYGDW